jgi:hypothetical protein
MIRRAILSVAAALLLAGFAGAAEVTYVFQTPGVT